MLHYIAFPHTHTYIHTGAKWVARSVRMEMICGFSTTFKDQRQDKDLQSDPGGSGAVGSAPAADRKHNNLFTTFARRAEHLVQAAYVLTGKAWYERV